MDGFIVFFVVGASLDGGLPGGAGDGRRAAGVYVGGGGASCLRVVPQGAQGWGPQSPHVRGRARQAQA